MKESPIWKKIIDLASSILAGSLGVVSVVMTLSNFFKPAEHNVVEPIRNLAQDETVFRIPTK